ncbi:T9SS type A sorting domain-containing protein [Aquimarina sp. RZ0]|uniref:T9SS type A sorting domain-containing protein n=1 Tax=Aquimarina sp. RZ0 TaxID=2607730 RepID=UPI0011F1C828|nr:T9SS type A sorting domain-containing protein [Aquimarina sp. RZ0]KAA1246713.1 T9SS type A sorting domain-containing protein [Aquimarina sp. RZ0]
MNTDRMMKLGLFALLLITLNTNAQVNDLRDWLNLVPANRPPLEDLNFSKEALSQSEATTALNLLIEEKQARMLDDFDFQWDNRVLKHDIYEMPFYYQIFGTEPVDGRSLFISLHGGGGVPIEANDQQYENQKHLYDVIMNSLEGVYLAPRAPTNVWNLWHQEHIDDFLNIIIQLAVIKENVNPNKVYILGYSAGGDGLYQLAPRMADRWAAASMMAGHPNDASPLSLRNTPFAIHVGALDSAFNRNGVAEEWGVLLDDLQANDPQGYVHDVNLHEGRGHWMSLEDAVALPWMKNYQRNPLPKKVVWKQDDRHHTSFYWLQVPQNKIVTGEEVVAEYNKSSNEINIIENYSDTLQLLINDTMLDLDVPITIKYQNTVIHQGMFHRTILNIYKSLFDKGDRNLVFPGMISIANNQTVTEEDVTLGLLDDIAIQGITIYPNPIVEYVNVDLLAKFEKETTISLIDIRGSIVRKIKTFSPKNKINLGALANSVYFLKIENDEKIHTYKILKL